MRTGRRERAPCRGAPRLFPCLARGVAGVARGLLLGRQCDGVGRILFRLAGGFEAGLFGLLGSFGGRALLGGALGGGFLGLAAFPRHCGGFAGGALGRILGICAGERTLLHRLAGAGLADRSAEKLHGSYTHGSLSLASYGWGM